jgi:hypothetical protein
MIATNKVQLANVHTEKEMKGTVNAGACGLYCFPGNGTAVTVG